MSGDQAVRATKDHLAYIQKNLSRGNATEHTHLPAVRTVIENPASGIGIAGSKEQKRLRRLAADCSGSRGTFDVGASRPELCAWVRMSRRLYHPITVAVRYSGDSNVREK